MNTKLQKFIDKCSKDSECVNCRCNEKECLMNIIEIYNNDCLLGEELREEDIDKVIF